MIVLYACWDSVYWSVGIMLINYYLVKHDTCVCYIPSKTAKGPHHLGKAQHQLADSSSWLLGRCYNAAICDLQSFRVRFKMCDCPIMTTMWIIDCKSIRSWRFRSKSWAASLQYSGPAVTFTSWSDDLQHHLYLTHLRDTNQSNYKE